MGAEHKGRFLLEIRVGEVGADFKGELQAREDTTDLAGLDAPTRTVGLIKPLTKRFDESFSLGSRERWEPHRKRPLRAHLDGTSQSLFSPRGDDLSAATVMMDFKARWW